MSVSSLLAAALLQTATPAPDLSWLAGYWLDCSGARRPRPGATRARG